MLRGSFRREHHRGLRGLHGGHCWATRTEKRGSSPLPHHQEGPGERLPPGMLHRREFQPLLLRFTEKCGQFLTWRAPLGHGRSPTPLIRRLSRTVSWWRAMPTRSQALTRWANMQSKHVTKGFQGEAKLRSVARIHLWFLSWMFTPSGGMWRRSGASGPNQEPLGSGGVERSLERQVSKAAAHNTKL